MKLLMKLALISRHVLTDYGVKKHSSPNDVCLGFHMLK